MAEENTLELPLEDKKPAEMPQETTPEAAAPEETPVAEVKSESTEAQAEPEPEQKPWWQKELGKKHAQIKDKERALEEKERELADLKAMLEQRSQPEQSTQQPTLPTAPVRALDANDPRVQEVARQIVEQQTYQSNLVKINSDGETKYGKDWTKSLENLATFGEVEMPVIKGIMATDDPAKVLYELGKNPSEYQRIMELPFERRQTEFVKLSLKQDASKPKPSNAPTPTEPVQARVQPSMDLSDKDDDETWYAKRKAMRAAKLKSA